MMKIGVFGGTQGVGLAFLQQAIAAGYTVTALARTPSKIDVSNDRLQVVQGNVLNAADVEKVVAGQDAIVNSLGGTKNNPNNVCTLGTKNIIAAMKQFNLKRLLTVTALGVADSRAQVPFAFKVIMKTVLRKAYADKETQERAIRASGLQWTIVRPGGLENGSKTGQWTVVKSGEKSPSSQIARADVAAFLMTQLGDDQYLYEAIGLVS